MYTHNYIIPRNSNTMYRNSQNYGSEDERFFLAPLLIGGLAGGALGYGIANNNQMNNNGGCCGWNFIPYPVPYQPVPIQAVPYQNQPTTFPNNVSTSSSSSSFSNNYYY